jgi:hypothetical protein
MNKHFHCDTVPAKLLTQVEMTAEPNSRLLLPDGATKENYRGCSPAIQQNMGHVSSLLYFRSCQ